MPGYVSVSNQRETHLMKKNATYATPRSFLVNQTLYMSHSSAEDGDSMRNATNKLRYAN